MLINSIVALAVALVVSFALTPFVKRLAWRLGAVDAPGGRRVHASATPRLGGLAVLAGYLVALGAVVLTSAKPFPTFVEPLVGFVAGGVFLAAVGAWDDVRALGAKKKLLAQTLAVSVAFFAGARIEQFDLPWFGTIVFGPVGSYLLSLVWSLAFINAINLIDGLDGLASGIVLFACITNTIVGFTTGNELAVVLNAALGGAVLAFLYFNFNPATIFLGDSGSMFLGYALATSALMSGRQKESTLVAFLVPLIALGVPLTDTLFTMVRRFLSRRPVFSPDRGHIHHRLLDLGLTHRRVVVFLYGATVFMCGTALVAAFGKDWAVGGALFAAAVVVIGGAKFAGYFTAANLLSDASSSPELDALLNNLPEFILHMDQARGEELHQRLGLTADSLFEPCGFVAARLERDGKSEWTWIRDCSATPGDIQVYRIRTLEGELIVHVPAEDRIPSPKVQVLLELAAKVVVPTYVEQPITRATPAQATANESLLLEPESR